MAHREGPARLSDTATPNPARIYDYLPGGHDNHAADREVADALIAAAPGARSEDDSHQDGSAVDAVEATHRTSTTAPPGRNRTTAPARNCSLPAAHPRPRVREQAATGWWPRCRRAGCDGAAASPVAGR